MMPRIKMENSLILWGEHSSGKSTLVKAFIKHLSVLGQKRGHPYTYRVIDGETDLPFFADDVCPSPTNNLYDRVIHIQRNPKNKQQFAKQKSDTSFRYTHAITVRDTMGAHTIEWSQVPASRFELDVSFDSFHHIIATIDPTDAANRTKNVENLFRLCEQLGQRSNRKIGRAHV